MQAPVRVARRGCIAVVIQHARVRREHFVGRVRHILARVRREHAAGRVLRVLARARREHVAGRVRQVLARVRRDRVAGRVRHVPARVKKEGFNKKRVGELVDWWLSKCAGW